jgi:hypothetical protein
VGSSVVIVRFKSGKRIVFELAAGFHESQGWLHLRDEWGYTINSFDRAEIEAVHALDPASSSPDKDAA